MPANLTSPVEPRTVGHAKREKYAKQESHAQVVQAPSVNLRLIRFALGASHYKQT
jgi:hypothetical protein